MYEEVISLVYVTYQILPIMLTALWVIWAQIYD